MQRDANILLISLIKKDVQMLYENSFVKLCVTVKSTNCILNLPQFIYVYTYALMPCSQRNLLKNFTTQKLFYLNIWHQKQNIHKHYCDGAVASSSLVSKARFDLTHAIFPSKQTPIFPFSIHDITPPSSCGWSNK